MIHRHITDTSWTPAALDSLLERGDLPDWRELIADLSAGDAELLDRLRASAARHPDLALFVEAVISAVRES
jgi:hypothetical protein